MRRARPAQPWRFTSVSRTVSSVTPCSGSREALFAFAQTVVDRSREALVVAPNPFYQIYEGAALLAGAQTAFANSDPNRNFASDWSQLDDATWSLMRDSGLLDWRAVLRGKTP